MCADSTRLDALKIDREARATAGRPRWWLAGLAVMLLAMAAAGARWWARPAASRVRTEIAGEVAAGVGGTVLNASGYVTARRQATVSSKVTGKVVEVLIEEGTEVDEGQVLARLDDANVGASLRLAEARRGAAETALGETEALLAEARLNLDRVAALVKDGVSSQAELDRSRAEAESLAARLERQRREVEVARRDVAVWRQQLEDTVIRAPFAGIVVAKNAQPGEMISPISAGGGFTRTGIGTVVDMSSLEVEVDVNEAYINRVEPGQRVEARLDAYPDWVIPCHVIAIIPTADRQKATVQVRVGFDALDPRILPDMGVKVAFRDGGAAPAGAPRVAISRRAVRRRQGDDVVLVVAGGRVERRAVTLGETASEDDRVIIASGLAAGERVVVEGPAELADGDRVEEEQ